MNLSSFKLTNINELISVYKENPERFNRFYNAVYLLLDGHSRRRKYSCNGSL